MSTKSNIANLSEVPDPLPAEIHIDAIIGFAHALKLMSESNFLDQPVRNAIYELRDGILDHACALSCMDPRNVVGEAA